MAKNIDISLTLGFQTCLCITTTGFEESDNVINGKYTFGFNSFVASANDDNFSLRILGNNLIINLSSIEGVTVNSSPITSFNDIIININTLV